MHLRLAAAVMAALLCLGSAAFAAPVCGPREAIARRLADGYAEVPVAAGATAAIRQARPSGLVTTRLKLPLSDLKSSTSAPAAVAPNRRGGVGET